MMREILFRGKQTDNKKWVVDNSVLFFKNSTKIYGALNEWLEVEVIPETVGQYTGLTDKNGTKIFEGDIVKCISRFDVKNMVVIFETAEFHLVDCQRYKNYTECCGYKYFGALETEVIGNIYDNPELLRGEEK